MGGRIAEQLLEVHRAVEQWQRCKDDLREGTRALTQAAQLLRGCLDGCLPTSSHTQQAHSNIHGRTEPPNRGKGDSSDEADGFGARGADGASSGHAASGKAEAHVNGRGGCTNGGQGREEELLVLACRELAQAQYLHALGLCAAGQGPAADPWVAGLGYRLRLSDQLWSACAHSIAGFGDSSGASDAAAGPLSATMAGTGAAATMTTTLRGFANSAPAPADGGVCTTSVPAPRAPSSAGGPAAAAVGLVPEPQRPPPLTPLLCDGVLPVPLLQRLAVAFDPAGATPYWRQHRYGRRRTPFFSYLYRLDQPPSSVVEEAIQHLHKRLLEAAATSEEAGHAQPAAEPAPPPPATPATPATPPAAATSAATVMATSMYAVAGRGAVTSAAGGDGAVGRHPRQSAALTAALSGVCVAEWWAHNRDPAAAHQLHFDVNEDVLRRGLDSYRLSHPRVSSVLYLPVAAPAVSVCTAPLTAAAQETTTATAVLGPGAEQGSDGWGTCPGGSTLVLDQTPTGARTQRPSQDLSHRGGEDRGTAELVPPLANRAWPAGPRPNRLLLFPGDLLHGVMPQPPQHTAASGTAVEPHAILPASYAGPPVTVPPASVGCPGVPHRHTAGVGHGADTNTQPPGTPAASPRRTTLIVAWWCSERLQTASAAPPLVLATGLATARSAGTGRGRTAAGACVGTGRKRRRAPSAGEGKEEGTQQQREARDDSGSDGFEEGSKESGSGATTTTTTTSSSSGSGETDSSDGSPLIGPAAGTVRDFDSSSSDDNTDGDNSSSGSEPCGMGGHLHGQVPGRHRTDWRHAGPLRPGMMLARPPALQALSVRLPHPKPGCQPPGPPPSPVTAPQPAASSSARSSQGTSLCGMVMKPGQTLSPLTRPPTWLEWFASLMWNGAIGRATDSCHPSESGVVETMWREPECVSPAWVPVGIRRPASLEQPGGTALQLPPPTSSAMLPLTAAVTAAGRSSGTDVESINTGKAATTDATAAANIDTGLVAPCMVAAEERDTISAPRTSGSGTTFPQEEHRQSQEHCVRDLARQAARGMAQVMGLQLALEQAEDMEAEDVEGQLSHREPSPSLQHVMHALALPQLRVFLAHPRDLANLYVPASSTIAST